VQRTHEFWLRKAAAGGDILALGPYDMDAARLAVHKQLWLRRWSATSHDTGL
jgi:hypothetical protein